MVLLRPVKSLNERRNQAERLHILTNESRRSPVSSPTTTVSACVCIRMLHIDSHTLVRTAGVREQEADRRCLQQSVYVCVCGSAEGGRVEGRN